MTKQLVNSVGMMVGKKRVNWEGGALAERIECKTVFLGTCIKKKKHTSLKPTGTRHKRRRRSLCVKSRLKMTRRIQLQITPLVSRQRSVVPGNAGVHRKMHATFGRAPQCRPG